MHRERDRQPHWTLEGCLLFVLVVGPAVAAGIIFDAKSGSVAEWVAALATTGALVAAVIAARYAAGALRIEQQREERVELDRRALQASQVAAWPEHALFESGGLDEKTGLVARTSVSGAMVRVRNASGIPVTRVSLLLFVEHPDRDGTGLCVGKAELDLLAPADKPMQMAVYREEGAEPPATSTEVLERGLPMHVTIMFRDAQGLDWVRDHTNGLVQMNG